MASRVVAGGKLAVAKGRSVRYVDKALGIRHQDLALEVVLPRSNNPASAFIHIWKSTTLSAKFNLPHWFLVRKRGGGDLAVGGVENAGEVHVARIALRVPRLDLVINLTAPKSFSSKRLRQG